MSEVIFGGFSTVRISIINLVYLTTLNNFTTVNYSKTVNIYWCTKVWKDCWQFYNPWQLDDIHILVNASSLLQLLITRGQLMAPSCPTHLQNLAQHWRNRDRRRCLFLSGTRTFSAKLSVSLGRLAHRRATLETRRWTETDARSSITRIMDVTVKSLRSVGTHSTAG